MTEKKEYLNQTTNHLLLNLSKDNTFTYKHGNVQCLSIEIYIFLNRLSPSKMDNIFKQNENTPLIN